MAPSTRFTTKTNPNPKSKSTTSSNTSNPPTDSDSDTDTKTPPTFYILFPLGHNPAFLTPKPDVDLFIKTIWEYTQKPRRRAKVTKDLPPTPPLDREMKYMIVRVQGWYHGEANMEVILEKAFEEAKRLGELVRKGELEWEFFVEDGGFRPQW